MIDPFPDILEQRSHENFKVLSLNFLREIIGSLSKDNTPYSKMAANKLFFCLHVY